MVNVYSDYSRARIGWFFGLSGAQLGTVAAGAIPVAWSIQRGAWLRRRCSSRCGAWRPRW